MPGPPPKPAELRQRRNKKAGATTLKMPPSVSAAAKVPPAAESNATVTPETAAASASEIPELPKLEGRDWHHLTKKSWERAWKSPMRERWLETDEDALGRLAILWDVYYKGDVDVLGEIRLQEQRFGITPLDRSRLNWELVRGDEAQKRMNPPKDEKGKKKPIGDPRAFLKEAKAK